MSRSIILVQQGIKTWKMKLNNLTMRSLFLVLMFVFTVSVNSNTTDSLKIVSLQREVNNLNVSVSHLQQEDQRQQKECEMLHGVADSLGVVQSQQANGMKTLAEKIGADLSKTNKNLQDSTTSLSDSINNRTWMAVCGILIALVLLGTVFFILRKKISSGSSAIDKIKSAQESLENAQKAMQEESVKLDSKLVELLDKQIAVMNPPDSNNSDDTIDHSFALKIGDEITKMEVNLSRMDPTIRGYKILCKGIERIKNNFLARDYEIVDMLGKPYNEGMKVVANFVSDDTLAEGEQKITGIIKPQINYKGKMIQSAQITVSQNL